ncbi:MAG: hypothetical protein QXU02_02560 [Candidatus Bathyarchaeia archaeon]
MLHKPLNLSLKSFSVYILCTVAAILSQYLLVTYFISEGLVDPTHLTLFSGFPELRISILFHLLPLNVILILLLDLVYLMRNLPASPRTASAKPHGRPQSLISRASTLFSRRDFEGAFIAVSLFLISLIITFTLLCPSALYNFAVSLYLSGSLLRSLVTQFGQMNLLLKGFIGSSAASFRRASQPLVEALTGINVAWKYLLCQNIAAWLTSIVALAYVRYCSKASKR